MIPGGEQDVSLEIDEFTLGKPNACDASSDCRDLVKCNGDAEYEGTPFSTMEGSQITIEYDDIEENHYYTTDGSLSWGIPQKCIVVNAVYKISMKLRSHQIEGSSLISSVQILMYLKGGNTIFEKAGECTEDAGKWVTCHGFIKVRPSLLDNANSFTINLHKVKGLAYDIDDIRYE